MSIAIFVIFALLIIGGAIYNHYQSEKRRDALRALALQNGWRFSESQESIEGRFPAFACLQRGDDRYAYNLLEGGLTQGEMCGFDYHYETESTDSKGRRQTDDHYFSALAIDTGLPLKPLLIRSENFFDKIGGLFGYDDIDFESAEFNRRFCVKAEDRRWAFDVIHQSTMEFLLAAPEFTIQFGGSTIMAYRGGLFDVGDFEQARQVVVGIIDRLPEYLLRELKGVEQ